jgi:hypothetical protein
VLKCSHQNSYTNKTGEKSAPKDIFQIGSKKESFIASSALVQTKISDLHHAVLII